MCGIWLYWTKNKKNISSNENIYKAFNKIQSRGPDRSELIIISNYGIVMGFHRLAIMDTSTKGDQPFVFENEDRVIYSMCNGEIYNYKELADKYSIVLNSGSDCEIIPHLYLKTNDFCKTTSLLSGEFAILLIEINKKTNTVSVHSSRDPFGVRPLFFGETHDSFCFSSELKAQVGIYENNDDFNVMQLKGGKCDLLLLSENGNEKISHDNFNYYDYPTKFIHTDFDLFKKELRDTVFRIVEKRLCSDRKIGFLLSGGVDSSAIVGIASKFFKKHQKKMFTFSIGMNGGTDEEFAKLAAKHIGLDTVDVTYGVTTTDEYNKMISDSSSPYGVHTHVFVSESQCLESIPKVVYITETYDLTTIRASVIQYLISDWISKHTDTKVLFAGELADEVQGSYLYFFNAPDPISHHNECVKLVDNIHYFDGLRADRCVANCGIELREPYSDTEFVDLIFSIDPKLRMPKTFGLEKYLIRESLKEDNILPTEVLFRRKEAFSCGCTAHTKSWFEIIRDHVEDKYTEKDISDFNTLHLKPYTKEGLYYRSLFETYFGNNINVSKIVPYYWLPSWCGDVKDPAARVLKLYNEKTN
jgi:asparagine synthase (glutamine-hydrolysing)